MRTLHVPAEWPTIQAAIDEARTGEVVIVAPGTYVGTLDFRGKAIEVLGTEGPTRTFLHPTNSESRVVLFHNGEGPDSRLMGFTIRFGAGGVSCDDFGPVASPYLSDCILERNYTDFLSGTGGAAGLDGDAILERCVLRQNNAFAFAGGALDGALTLLQCVIEDNWSCDGGGGLRLAPGSLVQECVIQRNGTGPCGYHGVTYTSLGGGILAPLGPVEIVGSVLRDNWVDEFTDPGDPGACGSGFNRGGGLHAGSGVTVRRCTIFGNRVENCAFAGGIQGSPTLIDSIVIGNEDATGFYAAQSSFRYSDVQGGAAGAGCFDADPRFVDPSGGDLRLHEGSPCIDAGDPTSAPDADGTRADLGAFPHPSAALPLTVAWHEGARLQAEDPAQSREFGTAAALEGDTALIGATGYGGPGAAHVFRREAGAWSEAARLTSSDAQPGDGFGAAVALDGNVAVVGAPQHDVLGGLDGAVYVFERSSIDAAFVETQRLLPRGQERDWHFGAALALEAGTLVVGATNPFGGQGHVFVFRRAGWSWEQVAHFSSAPYSPSLYGPLFGAALSISGTTIVVGAPNFEVDAQIPGRTFIYERAGATPYSWVLSAILAPEDTRGLGNFGASVSLSGDALLVGSDFGVFAYERRGPGLPWSRATRIGPFEHTRAFVQAGHAWLRGANGEIRELVQPSAGAAWSEVARFAASSGGALVADQGTLLVGAPSADQWVGACHVFTRGVQLDSITSDQAADEESVVLRGLELDAVTQVLVDGVEQPIVSQGPDQLAIRPARRAPGFADLALVAPAGTLTLPGGFESLPSLRASHTGLGGTLDVQLANGTSGAYLLLWSLDLAATPLTLHSPPVWYSLLLDLVPGRHGTLDTDAFTNEGSAHFSMAVPNDPALLGLTLHFQAGCQRGLFGPLRYSFTNLADVTF